MLQFTPAQAQVVDKLRSMLQVEEVDPSFFECEEDIPEPSKSAED